jgi:hypothetical protein
VGSKRRLTKPGQEPTTAMPAKVKAIQIRARMKSNFQTLQCTELSSVFRQHLEHIFDSEAKQSKLVIAKTIRLRWHHIMDWIDKTDYKASK